MQFGGGFNYDPPADGFNGEDTFTYTITNGADTASAMVTITVNPINDPPVITAPGPFNTNEDTAFMLSGFTITDVDSSDLTVTLSVDDGMLSSTMFSGTPAEVTAAINNVTYTPLLNSTAADNLEIGVSDGTLADNDLVNITINPINDGPVNTVPGPQTLFNTDTLSFTNNEFQVSDVDATTLEVNLAVDEGTLSIDSTGLTVTGNNSASLTVTGLIANLNSGLNSLIYDPDDSFIGDDILTMTTSDLGETGDGGTLTDIDTVTLTVEEQPSLINEKFEHSTISLATNTGFQVVNPTGTNNVLQSPVATRFASTTLNPSLTLPDTGVVVTAEVTTTTANDSRFSNGYIVFDYVNSTNYKVAGIEGKNQLWVIAQISGNTYTRLAQVFDSTLTQADTQDLELHMDLAGVNLATPSGLNDLSLSGNFLGRNVGVGTVLANSLFDCFRIDPLTPEVLISEDFDDGSILATNTGFSVVENGDSFLQSPAATRNATSTLVTPVTPTSNSLLISTTASLSTSTATRFSNGYIVFDYVDANNYKVAGVEAKNQTWVIAQVSAGTYSRLASVFDTAITETGTYDLQLQLTSTLAVLTTRSGLSNVQIGGSSFLTNNLGVGTVLASTQFDNFHVSQLNGMES